MSSQPWQHSQQHGFTQSPSSRSSSYGSDRANLPTTFASGGGDEAKLRKHYGLTAQELATADRTPPRNTKSMSRRPTWFVRSTGSVENLRQSGHRNIPNDSHGARPHLSAQLDNGLLPQVKKFSIRNVFGAKPGWDEVIPKSLTEDVTLPAKPHALNQTLPFDEPETKRAMLPASRRRISVENRRYSPLRISANSSLRDSASQATVMTLSSIDEAFLPAGRERSSTVRYLGHQPNQLGMDEASNINQVSNIMHETSAPSNESSLLLATSSDLHSSAAVVHNVVIESSSIAEIDIDMSQEPSEQLENVCIAEVKTRTADVIPMQASGTMAELFFEPEPSLATTPCETLAMHELYVDESDWATSTAPRKAMEAMSFFARMAQLEARMTSVERSMSKLSKSIARNNNKTHEIVDLKQTLRGMPATHPYSTPPASHTEEVGGLISTTWLDANSSVSSFADSINRVERKPSSTMEADTPLTSYSLPFYAKRLSSLPASDAKAAHDECLESNPSHTFSNVPADNFATLNTSGSCSRDIATIMNEMKSMHKDFDTLQKETSAPSSMFGKYATLGLSSQACDEEEDSIPFGHFDDEDDADDETDDKQHYAFDTIRYGRTNEQEAVPRASTVTSSWFWDNPTARRAGMETEPRKEEEIAMWRESLPVALQEC